MLSEFLKGLTRCFDEPFLSCLRSRVWGKARENWMLPVTAREAAVQPPSALAHVQPWGLVRSWRPGCIAPGPLSTRKVWDNPVCFPPKSGVCEAPATSGRWRGHLRRSQGEMAPPFHRFCTQAGLGGSSGLGQVNSRTHGGIWQGTNVLAAKNNSIAGGQQNNFPDGVISFLLDLLSLSSPSRVLLPPLF